MLKYLFLIALSIASCIYAINGIREIVFNDPTPFSIKCLGIRLDADRIYSITNAKTKPAGSIQVEYPNGRGLLPETLGTINFDPQARIFTLNVGGEVSDKKENSTNPFFAFARTVEKDWFGYGNFTYFDAGEKVTANLEDEGIVFNSPAGDKNSRVGLKIINFDDKQFLATKSEGLGVTYHLEAGKTNRFSVLCNQPPSSTAMRAYSFEKTTNTRCNFTIDATPISTFGVNYHALDTDGRRIVYGDENQTRFIVGDYLFEFKPSYSYSKLAPMIFGLVIIVAFQILFLKHFEISGSPTVQAVIAARILFNCLAFLSVPLYLTVTNSGITSNRSGYWFSLVVLNATYFAHIFLIPIRNLGFVGKVKEVINSRRGKVLSACLLAAIVLVVANFAENESLGPVPVLHVVKISIICLMYALYGFPGGGVARNTLVLTFAGVMSYLASDFGSIIYCTAAFALIAFFSGHVWKWKYGLAILGLLVVGVAVGAFLLTNGSVAGGKGYRLYAQYVQPDSQYLSDAKEADRETYSHLNLIQKHLIAGNLPETRDVVVPGSMRTTAFSDYALFWSLVYGKLTFAILFGLSASLLIYQLSFLLILTIRPINIGNGMAYLLPVTRESQFIQFLIALTIVSVAYPILSNLLIAPLTGQSFPNISISRIEPLFLALLLVMLSIVFMDRRYEQPTDPRIVEDYRGILTSLKTGGLLVLVVFAALLFMRWSYIQLVPNEYRWTKATEEINEETDIKSGSFNVDDANSLRIAGRKLIGDNFRTSVDSKKKPLLKNLSSLYFSKVPYSRIRIENAKFELTSDALLRRMNADSYFTVQSKQVSGERAPFGRVMAFEQLINGERAVVYSNDFYASIPQGAKTIKADLTSELSKALEDHLKKTGASSNKGSILIVNNSNAGIVANSTFPLLAETNSNEIHYLIGSLKKAALAYAALATNSAYKDRNYNNISFNEFMRVSDDLYAAHLLKDVMQNQRSKFGDVLEKDLALPLVSKTDDSFFDQLPAKASYSRPLDRNNEIFRISIGQEKPYRFVDVVQWYARIASGKKLTLNYSGNDVSYDELSIDKNSLRTLRASMNTVLSGTASVVGEALDKSGFQKSAFIAKTGTAEHSSGKYNSSSSIILASRDITIGIMINGVIPENNRNLAAKDLMVTIIPILRRYNMLRR